MGLPSPTLTREQIASRILAGENIVILENKAIRVPPSWLTAHPGGALAILHYVGRDASDEVSAFHPEATLKRISQYTIGTVETGEHGWEPLVPPVMSGWVRRIGADGSKEWHREADAARSSVDTKASPATSILLVKRDESSGQTAPTLATLEPGKTSLSPKMQAQHSQAYKELHKRVTDAGLFQTRYITGYGPEVARYLLLVTAAAYTYYHKWFLISAAFLGLFWHQVTFAAHDFGHNSVTHNLVIDRLLGTFIANACGGLSINWWVDNHNIHHLMTNHPSHDPDIQHLPFFAISPVFLTNLWSSYYKRIMAFDAVANLVLRIQHRLFYVVMSLARFNLFALSYIFLAKNAFKSSRFVGGRWWLLMEFGCIGIFWCWYGSVLRGIGNWKTALLYLLVSNVVASPLHVQIVLSHFSRSTADLGPSESFPARQLRTTSDVICPPEIEFIHGGLHLQVTHHFFPRLPRHNLRAASLLVKEFAKEQGLEYAEFGFVEGNGDVISTLKGVADQVKIVGMVADSHIREALVDMKHD
ncbi:hypothetical protein EIP91_005733 [Steccherinum ochraceum]|uniref:Delta 8-(E)-sphingolipid desaturase n=1 Tax=Steccherinum ochraceum TaxID=92696 RepID=A0A4R0RVN1_9APHY|nr:hypothetical protein EIP91_005733 [Steccherinum ochraceum]